MKNTLGPFNTAAQYANISISDIRSVAQDRLTQAQFRLDPRGSFRQAANNNHGDSFFAGLLLNMMLGHFIMQGLQTFNINVPGMTGAEDISSSIDGLEMTEDEGVTGSKSRFLSRDLYPQGRRRDKGGKKDLQKAFNLLAGNDNNHFVVDAKAEVSCMNEIIDMLNTLENQGVRALHLNAKAGVYDTLKRNKARKSASFGPFVQTVRKLG